MKVYKGTDKNMQCIGYQYEIGKTAVHEGEIELCKSGFHACENPLDVLAYYPAYDGARYFEAEADGDVKKTGEDSKLACTKLTLTGEIGLMGLIKAGVTAIFEKAKKIPATSGYQSTAATSGYQSTAATSGEQSTAATSGDWSTAATSGARSTAATSGYQSTAATSGEQSTAATSGAWSTAATSGARSTAATSGYQSTAATSGYQSTAVTSGAQSTAATSGDQSTAATSGEQSIAVANGREAGACGKIGSYIVVTEYDDDYKLIDCKCAKVDGVTIKENVVYILKNGEFVEGA